MNTEQKIEQQLQEDFDKFYNKTYDGDVEVPPNIIELFKKGAMPLALFFHKINAYKLKAIAAKDYRELTYGDLKDMITVILNAPLEKMYLRFEDAVNNQIQFQKFVLCYNNAVDDFNSKLKMKKVSLLNLSTGVPNNSNGMRIIN